MGILDWDKAFQWLCFLVALSFFANYSFEVVHVGGLHWSANKREIRDPCCLFITMIGLDKQSDTVDILEFYVAELDDPIFLNVIRAQLQGLRGFASFRFLEIHRAREVDEDFDVLWPLPIVWPLKFHRVKLDRLTKSYSDKQLLVAVGLQVGGIFA